MHAKRCGGGLLEPRIGGAGEHCARRRTRQCCCGLGRPQRRRSAPSSGILYPFCLKLLDTQFPAGKEVVPAVFRKNRHLSKVFILEMKRVAEQGEGAVREVQPKAPIALEVVCPELVAILTGGCKNVLSQPGAPSIGNGVCRHLQWDGGSGMGLRPASIPARADRSRAERADGSQRPRCAPAALTGARTGCGWRQGRREPCRCGTAARARAGSRRGAARRRTARAPARSPFRRPRPGSGTAG